MVLKVARYVHGLLYANVYVCVWLTPCSHKPRSGLLGPAANEFMQQITCPCMGGVGVIQYKAMTIAKGHVHQRVHNHRSLPVATK
jgi:hypothetical protein